VFFVSGVPAVAQKTGKPGVFDYYLLTLSWSPQFCTTKPSDPQCDGTRHFGFVVHGMWPQYQNNTWPQDCSQDPGLKDPSSMLDIMPSTSLISHEWSKHGTCSGLDAQGYFALTRQAFQSIKIPEAYQLPTKTLTVKLADLKKAFEAANPALGQSNFSVGCSGVQLSQVQICLDKQLHPVACRAKDKCKRDPIAMPPVR
jgi:ribonuclease T2